MNYNYIAISQLISRVKCLQDETSPSPDHMIVEPLEFKGQITRSLSSWCSAVPAIDVQANLQTLKVIRVC